MKQLLIIGARQYGRELLDLILDSINTGEIEVAGYLDSDSHVLDSFEGYPPIISSVEEYEVKPDDLFVCAMGDLKYRKHYAQLILDKGGRFLNLIHPTALISRRVSMGQGCIIGKYAIVNSDVIIGDFVSVAAQATLSHDNVIGNFVHIGGGTGLAGGVIVDDEVTIHPHSYVVPHKHIHTGATLSAGSVVFTNVKANTTVFGNPAKKMEL